MNRQIEIVILTHHMGNAGAERVLSVLANYWAEIGLHITVFQTGLKRNINNYKLHDGIKIIDIGYSDKIFSRTRQTIKIIEELRPIKSPVLISFTFREYLLATAASIFVKTRKIFSERNDPVITPPQKIKKLWRNLFFTFADVCIFQTKEAKEYFSKRIQNHSYIIPNPINPTLPSPFTGKRRKVIITAARLEKQKNLLMLIEAFSLFQNKYPDYSLEIYGRGSLENELKDFIKKRGIQESANIMGYSDDIYLQMRDCSMYISSSDYEGISNSMLEALGLGLPTICTDCPAGGARETIQDGVNGLLVPVGDVQALYKAMCRVADNPVFAESLSRNAIKVREGLSVDIIAQRWLDILDAEIS